MDRLLKKFGFLEFSLAGREPDGIVDPADFERVRDQVMDALSNFVDPKTGKRPVKAIHRREEIFKGKYADLAPDILMEPEVGYSLTHAKTALEDADWISGDRRPEGVIVAAGPGVKPFEQPPMLIDLAPTILAALQAPASIEAHRTDPARGRGRRGRGHPPRGRSAGGRDPGHADRRGRPGGQRHRGRRDGGAPPRPRLHRVGAALLPATADTDPNIARVRGILVAITLCGTRRDQSPLVGVRHASVERGHQDEGRERPKAQTRLMTAGPRAAGPPSRPRRRGGGGRSRPR